MWQVTRKILMPGMCRVGPNVFYPIYRVQMKNTVTMVLREEYYEGQAMYLPRPGELWTDRDRMLALAIQTINASLEMVLSVIDEKGSAPLDRG